jgi:hypothetical protein
VVKYRKEGLDREGLLLLLLFVSGALSFNQTMVRTDFAHLLQSIHIPYILGIYLIDLLCRRTQRRYRRFATGIKAASVFLVFLLCILYSSLIINSHDFYSGTIGLAKGTSKKLDIPFAGVWLTPEQADEIEDLVGFIQKKTGPDDKILVLPYDPMVYFLSGRKNPTHQDAVLPGTLSGKGMEDAFISEIDERRVPLIVFSDMAFTPSDNSRFSHYSRRLYEYIISNYQLAHQSGRFNIYIRNGVVMNASRQGE